MIPRESAVPGALDRDPDEDILAFQDSRSGLIRAIVSDPLSLAGLIVTGVCVFLALAAPFITPRDPGAVDLSLRNLAPSLAHWCGTDALGRDVFSRILYGLRLSLFAGILPSLAALGLGALIGVAAGHLRGAVDFSLMRLCDAALAFPSVLLALALMYALGPGVANICLAIVLTGWTTAARVCRSLAQSLSTREYVLAAKAMGLSRARIMLRHILPGCLPALAAVYAVAVPEAVLFEASLSFLGVGARPPEVSLGLMAAEGKRYLLIAPWAAIAPGLAAFVLVMGVNLLGRGARKALDAGAGEKS